jgi:hypothetical protein
MSKLMLNVTVAAGQSVSNFADLRNADLKAVRVAPGATGSWISFIRSESGASGYSRGPDNLKLTAAFTAGDWTELLTSDLAGVDRLAVQLCADESGAPSVQSETVAVSLVAL